MLLVVGLLVFAGCQEVMGRLAPVPEVTTVHGVDGPQAIRAEAGGVRARPPTSVKDTRLSVVATRVRLGSRTPAPEPPAPLLIVRFQYDKACVNESVAAEIRGWAGRLAPGTTVSVEGHTDAHNSRSYNLDLSRRRIATVAELLHGLATERHAYGETRPVAPNTRAGDDNPRGRMRNRRVEVRLVQAGDGREDRRTTAHPRLVGPAPC